MAAASVTVNEVFHIDANGKSSGLDPQQNSYRSFAAFQDPDGNRWVLQEITSRFPGHIDSSTTSFASATDLESALRRAAAAHGQHVEMRSGCQRDENWPNWYAAYMVAEQSRLDTCEAPGKSPSLPCSASSFGRPKRRG
jgi:hypothetical protein